MQIKGKERIVNIDGLDANSCGGTHLRNLAEIEPVDVSLSQYDPATGEGIVSIL